MVSTRIAFFASRNGSSMCYLLDAMDRGELDIEPVLVLSNRIDAPALETARRRNIAHICLNEEICGGEAELDARMAQTLTTQNAEWVVLSGYMRRIGLATLQAFDRRILNIHPSLLPAFGGPGMYGRRVHQAVIDAGVKQTGATVHLVDELYDHGRILSQIEVPVYTGDTPESLSQRVATAEGPLYLRVLKQIVSGELAV